MNIFFELKKHITESFIENPRYDLKVYDYLVKNSFLKLISIFGIFFSMLNLSLNIYINFPRFPYSDLVTVILFSITYLLTRFEKSHKYIAVLLFMTFCYILLFSIFFVKHDNYDFVPIMVFPLAIYNFLGLKYGTPIALLSIFIYTTTIVIVATGLIPVSYSTESLLFILTLLIIITIISYFSELRRNTIQDLLIQKLYFDDECGLGNRKMLIEDIELSISPVLFIIKIKNFSEISRFFGYKSAIEFIQFLGNRLNDFESKYNLKYYSISGGEFAILSNIMEDNEKIFEVGNEVGNTLFEHFAEKDFHLKNNLIPITLNIGAAHYSTDNISLISKANIALHHAINLNIPFYFYNNDIQISDYTRHLDTLSELNYAIRNNKIIPYFQPIICNKSGEVLMFECLMRIVNRNNEIEGPQKYLDAARRTRLHHLITELMFKKVFEMIKDKEYIFTLNISAHDIKNKEFMRLLSSLAEKYPENCGKIILEIIESESIDKITEIAEFIKEVKLMGYRIAVDDFGSGYSNFSNIFNLEPDFIKFDGSLIRDICNDPKTKILIRNLSIICKELNIQTIAEFVEHVETLETVQGFNIDFSQGFSIGTPGPEIKKPEA